MKRELAESNINEITFSNLVKLYMNHRPAKGIKIKEIVDAITFFSKYQERQHSMFVSVSSITSKSEQSSFRSAELTNDDLEKHINMNNLIKILTKKGEAIPESSIQSYFNDLLSLSEDSETTINEYKKSMTVKNFLTKLLGVTLNDSFEVDF